MKTLLQQAKARCRHCAWVYLKGKTWYCNEGECPCTQVRNCLEWMAGKGRIGYRKGR